MSLYTKPLDTIKEGACHLSHGASVDYIILGNECGSIMINYKFKIQLMGWYYQMVDDMMVAGMMSLFIGASIAESWVTMLVYEGERTQGMLTEIRSKALVKLSSVHKIIQCRFDNSITIAVSVFLSLSILLSKWYWNLSSPWGHYRQNSERIVMGSRGIKSYRLASIH